MLRMKRADMWISIIIPVYNVEKYIKKCLDSIVLQQKGIASRIEVIAVDDGSTDASGEILDEYARTFCTKEIQNVPIVKVIHQVNSGVAAARNAALEVAEGKWIYFCDSDDWLEEGALWKLYLRKSEISEDTDIVLLDAYQNKEKQQILWEHFSREMSFEKEQINALERGALYFPACKEAYHVSLAAPWDKLFRHEFLKRNQLKFCEDLKVLDDMVFNMEAMGKADKVQYLKEKLYHYRYVPNSITNSYKENRDKQDSDVWDTIATYLKQSKPVYEEKLQENTRYIEQSAGEIRQNHTKASYELLEQAFYCRIIKSFSICCRLCFFHDKNPKSKKQQIHYAKSVSRSGWYKIAFENVKFSKAEWKLKIMILFVRLGWGRGIYLLHCLENHL